MEKIFKQNLKRFDLLKIKKNAENHLKIMIHRNHSFEMISSVLNPFLNYFNFDASFDYSSYDDSLTFPQEMNADLHILWLDLNRYNRDTVEDFINEKILELSSLTKSPIILAYIGDIKQYKNDKAYIVNIDNVIEELGDKAFDLEKEKYSGTRLSSKASILIAQYLGLKIIPSLFIPQIKAIVTDLDNTFYQGILGEDGIDKLISNNNYQLKLKEFAEQGYMICISSKNDEDEVEKMFNIRKDFKLNLKDFTCHRINWNSKAENISSMAKEMNIGLDSILFIDDNIAEIENVKTLIPQIKTILFNNDESISNVLDLYPGFLKSSITKEDKLRSQDIKANQERLNLAKTLTKEEYFKKLELKIDITLNDIEHIDRITELLNKTNQFILSYKRYDKFDVEKILKSNNSCIITASMKDKLSDSGIIAILICDKEKESLVVDELTFSCRALGRNIEDIVISKMLLLAQKHLKTSNEIKINYKKGPRNAPAQKWLSEFCKQELLKDEGQLKYLLLDNIETFGLEVSEYYDK